MSGVLVSVVFGLCIAACVKIMLEELQIKKETDGKKDSRK